MLYADFPCSYNTKLCSSVVCARALLKGLFAFSFLAFIRRECWKASEITSHYVCQTQASFSLHFTRISTPFFKCRQTLVAVCMHVTCNYIRIFGENIHYTDHGGVIIISVQLRKLCYRDYGNIFNFQLVLWLLLS